MHYSLKKNPKMSTEYSERMLHLGNPTLEYRRNGADMIKTYKIINKTDTKTRNNKN
jgi:hypothetical protein